MKSKTFVLIVGLLGLSTAFAEDNCTYRLIKNFDKSSKFLPKSEEMLASLGYRQQDDGKYILNYDISNVYRHTSGYGFLIMVSENASGETMQEVIVDVGVERSSIIPPSSQEDLEAIELKIKDTLDRKLSRKIRHSLQKCSSI